MAQGVPGRLRPQIFLTFGTTRVVGCQPYAPAAFTPGEIPGNHFSEAESTPGHMVLSEGTTEKLPNDTKCVCVCVCMWCVCVWCVCMCGVCVCVCVCVVCVWCVCGVCVVCVCMCGVCVISVITFMLPGKL